MEAGKRDALVRWIGIGGAVLVVAIIAWQLGHGSYKGDIQKICDAETYAGVQTTKDAQSVSKWTKEHLDTPEGSAWYTDLMKKGPSDRAKALDEEAKKLGLKSCPIVASYQAQAVEGQYRSDLQLLCSLSGMTGIDKLSDDDKLAKIQKWGETSAKSPRTKEAIAKLAAAPAKQRGDVLRATANDASVYICELANVLAQPPAPEEQSKGFIKLAAAEINGDVTQEGVFAAVTKDMEPFRKCYEAGLAKNKALAGRITIRITIEPGGKVAGARATNGPPSDKEIAQCMAKAIENVKMPETKSKMTTVMLHLDLVPDGDALAQVPAQLPPSIPGLPPIPPPPAADAGTK